MAITAHQDVTHIADGCIIGSCLPEEQVPTVGTQYPLRQRTPRSLGAAATNETRLYDSTVS